MRYPESLEDGLKLITVAWARTLTDSGERHGLEDVAAGFGVDLDKD
ncbi:hypothetical protein [Actinokineospora sp. 24-640]